MGITRRLKMLGVEVHIYTMKWWDGKNTIDFSGVRLHAICKQRPLYCGERRSIMQALMFGLATFKLIAAKFDVLDVDHMPYFPLFAARIICALRRKRMIATWHEVWGNAYWRNYLGRLAPISTVTEWLAARMPKEIVSVTSDINPSDRPTGSDGSRAYDRVGRRLGNDRGTEGI